MENNLKDQHYKNMGIMLQMETLTFVYKGVPHDFMFYGFPESYAAYEQVCKWINESVNK